MSTVLQAVRWNNVFEVMVDSSVSGFFVFKNRSYWAYFDTIDQAKICIFGIKNKG